MWWIVVPLILIVAFVGYTLLLNAGPARCPSCKRINIFRRTRTGRRRDECDEAGDLRRRLTEYVCGRCGGRYWIVWDDFEGRRAAVSSAPDTDTEPDAAGGIHS